MNITSSELWANGPADEGDGCGAFHHVAATTERRWGRTTVRVYLDGSSVVHVTFISRWRRLVNRLVRKP